MPHEPPHAPHTSAPSSVGSRTGAVPRRRPLGCVRLFQLRARLGVAVSPSPAPATSNPAGRFPAPGFPARFTSRVMGPIDWERFRPGSTSPRLLHLVQPNQPSPLSPIGRLTMPRSRLPSPKLRQPAGSPSRTRVTDEPGRAPPERTPLQSADHAQLADFVQGDDVANGDDATTVSEASHIAQSGWSGKVGAAPGDPIELEGSVWLLLLSKAFAWCKRKAANVRALASRPHSSTDPSSVHPSSWAQTGVTD